MKKLVVITELHPVDYYYKHGDVLVGQIVEDCNLEQNSDGFCSGNAGGTMFLGIKVRPLIPGAIVHGLMGKKETRTSGVNVKWVLREAGRR